MPYLVDGDDLHEAEVAAVRLLYVLVFDDGVLLADNESEGCVDAADGRAGEGGAGDLERSSDGLQKTLTTWVTLEATLL